MGTLLNLDQRLTQYNKFDFMTDGGQIWGVGGGGEGLQISLLQNSLFYCKKVLKSKSGSFHYEKL